MRDGTTGCSHWLKAATVRSIILIELNIGQIPLPRLEKKRNNFSIEGKTRVEKQDNIKEHAVEADTYNALWGSP